MRLCFSASNLGGAKICPRLGLAPATTQRRAQRQAGSALCPCPVTDIRPPMYIPHGSCSTPQWPLCRPFAICHLLFVICPFAIHPRPFVRARTQLFFWVIAHCSPRSSMELFVGDVYRRNLCEHPARPAIFAGPRSTPGAASHHPHHKDARSTNLAVRVFASAQGPSPVACAPAPNGGPRPICHMPSAICHLTSHHSPLPICRCPFTIVHRPLPIAYMTRSWSCPWAMCTGAIYANI